MALDVLYSFSPLLMKLPQINIFIDKYSNKKVFNDRKYYIFYDILTHNTLMWQSRTHSLL